MDEIDLNMNLMPFEDTTGADDLDVYEQLRALQNDYLTEDVGYEPTPVQAHGQNNINFEAYDSEVKTKAAEKTQRMADAASTTDMHLSSLYGRESNPNKGENYLHTGLEGRGKTSQYGVRQQDFPKLEGETYKQQAGRVLEKKLHRVRTRTPRFTEASNELQSAIVPVMWNIGENSGAIKKFDYDNVKASAVRIMQYYKYTPQGKKERVPHKGLMNARMKDWNAIAETPEGIKAGMYPINKYEEYLNQTDS